MKKTIIIYDDNPVYGGHQIMSAYGVEALAEDVNLAPIFYVNPDNQKLINRVEDIALKTGNLIIRTTGLKTRKMQGVRNHLSGRQIRKLRQEFISNDPAMILCIQGEIENSSQALLAGAKMNINCISYIPVPHRMALMGAKLGALRDMFNKYLFNKLDGYITISPSMAELLRERGVRCPIDVVYNGIDTENSGGLLKEEACESFGLPNNKTIIGMIGRIEFNQKRHNLMLETMHDNPKIFDNTFLAIMGGGPDEKRLRRIIADYGMEDRVKLLPWSDNPRTFYNAIDFLMLPSRFEGVPLVMLEALCAGVPVVGSRRDGMADILPAEWLFEPENSAALAKTFDYVRQHGDKSIEGVQKKIKEEMTLESFKNSFCATVKKWAGA